MRNIKEKLFDVNLKVLGIQIQDFVILIFIVTENRIEILLLLQSSPRFLAKSINATFIGNLQ